MRAEALVELKGLRGSGLQALILPAGIEPKPLARSNRRANIGAGSRAVGILRQGPLCRLHRLMKAVCVKPGAFGDGSPARNDRMSRSWGVCRRRFLLQWRPLRGGCRGCANPVFAVLPNEPSSLCHRERARRHKPVFLEQEKLLLSG